MGASEILFDIGGCERGGSVRRSGENLRKGVIWKETTIEGRQERRERFPPAVLKVEEADVFQAGRPQVAEISGAHTAEKAARMQNRVVREVA
jgi:hypothetical protein